jgi:hypothetical protein
MLLSTDVVCCHRHTKISTPKGNKENTRCNENEKTLDLHSVQKIRELTLFTPAQWTEPKYCCKKETIWQI